tara:strand:- start:859 stop:1221 length:363 start_codon:yes stop_codon:yes gene_type:complete
MTRIEILNLAIQIQAKVFPKVKVELTDDHIYFDGWVTLRMAFEPLIDKENNYYIVEKVLHSHATRDEPEDVDIEESMSTYNVISALKRCFELTMANQLDMFIETIEENEVAEEWLEENRI